MVKKIRCDVVNSDWIKASASDRGDHVLVRVQFGGEYSNVMLTPPDARKLRKQIKKSLEAIEGTEQESEA